MDDAGPRVVETHVSYTFLVGDRAYKLKKPVRYPFVDLTTRELREAVCHREVELNRRLAPDVYLGVLDVVDENGDMVDHLVEMKRLPDVRRLATLVENGDDVGDCLRQLAHDLAAFHADAATADEIAAAGTPQAVRDDWIENLDEMRRFVPALLDAQTFERIGERALRYIDGRGALFASRIAEGRIVDGHGDLLADDIFCMDDGPRALDCIEYNDRFRWGDVLADVAFLAMDLERLGSPDLAGRFLSWYRGFSRQTYPQSLVDHYVAYRASIRSKIACLKHEQGDEPSLQRAQRLLDLCDRRLDAARVRLVLVGGLPGTGKSTLADRIAARTGWAVLRSDKVRKEIAGIPSGESAHSAFGEGIYSSERSEQTYDELLRRTRMLLDHGTSVVCDASWIAARHRKEARDLSESTHSDLVQLRCVLDPALAAERMRRREAGERRSSDADAAVAEAMGARMESWPEADEVDTERSPDEVVAAVLVGQMGDGASVDST